MQLLLAIVGSVLAIFIIVVLHEWGHFAVARFFGIRILRFSIGFGKALYTWRGKTGTEYVLAAIPLGGYVRMLGEDGTEAIPVSPELSSGYYHTKPLGVRMAVVLAGPLVNFILAIFVFWLAFMLGSEHLKPIVGPVVSHSLASRAGMQNGDEMVAVDGQLTQSCQQVALAIMAHMGNKSPIPITVKQHSDHISEKLFAIRLLDLSQWTLDKKNPEILESLGIRPYMPPMRPIVTSVMAHSPAALAGVKVGDEIQMIRVIHPGINQKFTLFAKMPWSQIIQVIQKMPEKWVVLTVSHHSRQKQLSLQLRSTGSDQKKGYLGVVVSLPPYPPQLLYREQYGPAQAFIPAIEKTWMLARYNAIFLKKLFTAKLSMNTIGGPISIFQAAGQASQAGWTVYLSFIGFVSVSIGFINLLPVPGLDGGHFLFQVIETVARRPVPVKIQQYVVILGIFLITLVILHATVNDIIRIFSG